MSINHSENIIELEGIGFTYNTQVVLRDISFAVHRGDYLGIVGPNGGGKTTLLKIMLGLLRPQTGQVKLFGMPSDKLTGRQRIGYVPQQAAHVDRQFPVTVQEVVAMGRYARVGLLRRLKSVDRLVIDQALADVGLYDYRHQLIGRLSGGQQQRAFIARALAAKPEVLILDEPTVGVDVQAQNQFYELLRRLNREHDLTLVLVSHDLDVVARETTEIACINQTVTYHGLPAAFMDEPLQQAFGPHRLRINHHHS